MRDSFLNIAYVASLIGPLTLIKVIIILTKLCLIKLLIAYKTLYFNMIVK